MVKIVLGKKLNIERRGMVAKGIEARKVDVYYILESLPDQFQIATYEMVDENDKALEIDGKYYKPISYENNKYFGSVFEAMKGYLKMRQLKPNRDITSLQELHKEMELLKKEAEQLYGLVDKEVKRNK
jgi:hypothetical protein